MIYVFLSFETQTKIETGKSICAFFNRTWKSFKDRVLLWRRGNKVGRDPVGVPVSPQNLEDLLPAVGESTVNIIMYCLVVLLDFSPNLLFYIWLVCIINVLHIGINFLCVVLLVLLHFINVIYKYK